MYQVLQPVLTGIVKCKLGLRSPAVILRWHWAGVSMRHHTLSVTELFECLQITRTSCVMCMQRTCLFIHQSYSNIHMHWLVLYCFTDLLYLRYSLYDSGPCSIFYLGHFKNSRLIDWCLLPGLFCPTSCKLHHEMFTALRDALIWRRWQAVEICNRLRAGCHNSCHCVFPEATLKGWSFHFCQSLYRCVHRDGLKQ